MCSNESQSTSLISYQRQLILTSWHRPTGLCIRYTLYCNSKPTTASKQNYSYSACDNQTIGLPNSLYYNSTYSSCLWLYKATNVFVIDSQTKPIMTIRLLTALI